MPETLLNNLIRLKLVVDLLLTQDMKINVGRTKMMNIKSNINSKKIQLYNFYLLYVGGAL